MVSSGISSNVISNYPVDSQFSFGTKSSDTDFGAIMSQSMTGSVSQQTDYLGTSVQSKVQQSKTADTAKDNKTNVQSQSSDTSSKVKQKTDDKDTSGKVSQNNDSSKMDKSVDKTASVKTQDAVKKIKDKLADTLNVSDEEIEDALSALGFTMADLLDESNFTDFVVELTGMESSLEILTDPDMNLVITDLTQTVNDIADELKTELGISDEELQNLLSNVEVLEVKTQEQPQVVRTSDKNTEFTAVDRKQTDEKPFEKLYDTPDENTGKIQVKVSEETELSASAQKDSENAFPERSTKSSHAGEDYNDVASSIVNNLNEAVNEAFEASEVNELVDPARIMEQIVESAKVTLNQETTTMEMMLNPENLGKVNLNVSVKEGVVTATLTAQDELVKSAIENQLLTLKESLNNQGLKVEAVEVTVESHAFEAGTQFSQNSGYQGQEQQERKGSRPLRLDSISDLAIEQLTDDEKLVLDMMQKEGNQVNFTA
jgi:flagellar hook-length control protein FliK